MLESFVPSVVIAASTVVAFIVGRVIAWSAARTRFVRAARVVVIALAVAIALFFFFSRSSRYALLLPGAFALGFLLYGRKRIAPGVFD